MGAEGEARLTTTGWIAIVNPNSRGGRVPASLHDDLRAVVDDVLVSERPGHVGDLVARARHAHGLVVAGGDGTIFEVLQSCDRASQRIAVLPLGRGNSLARDLGARSVADGIRAIGSGVDRRVDLLDVTLRHDDGREWRGVSASNLAIGYPADVVRMASRFRSLGAQSYTVAGVLASPHPFDTHVVVDDEPGKTRPITGLIISNSRYVGPFLGFPGADLADGRFHLMTLHASRLRQLAHNLSSVTGLAFCEPAGVRDLRALHVSFSRPMLVKIDGELREDVREIDVRIAPGAATFRVPAVSRG